MTLTTYEVGILAVELLVPTRKSLCRSDVVSWSRGGNRRGMVRTRLRFRLDMMGACITSHDGTPNLTRLALSLTHRKDISNGTPESIALEVRKHTLSRDLTRSCIIHCRHS